MGGVNVGPKLLITHRMNMNGWDFLALIEGGELKAVIFRLSVATHHSVVWYVIIFLRKKTL